MIDRTRVFLALGFGVGFAALAVACVGDSPAGTGETSGSSGTGSSSSGEGTSGSSGTSSSSGESSSSGQASSSSSSSSSSSGTVSSSSGEPDAGCTEPASCSEGDIVTCGVRTTCDFGCTAAGGVRCKTFEPSGIVTAADLRTEGLADFVFDGTKADLATGQIRASNDGEIRTPNDDPAVPQVKNGVRFWRTASAVVIQAKNITFQGAASTWVLGDASVPLILIATEVVEVKSNVSFPCGKLGGGAGGAQASAGSGATPGPGARADGTGAFAGGAAGGTHATQGGGGGLGWNGALVSGAVPPFPTGVVFQGGSGGGGGSPGHHSYALGGGGGAAVQIIAGRAIHIGDGNALAGGVLQGFSVGGCGGRGGADVRLPGPPSVGSTRAPGAGGGSGGFLLLESPVVTGALAAGIAANGGGGAGGGVSGQSASLSATAAAPGTGSTCGRAGGRGAAGALFQGPGLDQMTSDPACAEGVGGGGGGGASGRIVVNTLTTAGVAFDAAAATPFLVSTAAYGRGALSAED